MAKAKRGKNLTRDTNWRGECPECKRTGVKLLWTKSVDGGEAVSVCKRCSN